MYAQYLASNLINSENVSLNIKANQKVNLTKQ